MKNEKQLQEAIDALIRRVNEIEKRISDIENLSLIIDEMQNENNDDDYDYDDDEIFDDDDDDR